MSKADIKCPTGHANPQGQQYCGKCGAYLGGLCPNGHFNRSAQHFCGQCGVAMGTKHQSTPRSVQPPKSPAPLSKSSGSAWSRFVDWWRRLSILKRVAIVLAGLLIIIGLNSFGAFQSPKFRECVSFSKAEYQRNFGTRPVGQDLDSLEVVCRRMIDSGLWK